MRDTDFAKQLFDKENYTIVIVKNREIIYTSRDRGIKPVYTAVKEYKKEIEGACAVDKVVGKAAAMLYKYGGIKELSTRLISQSAIDILEDSDIVLKYENRTQKIMNRTNTGMCPVEELSQNIEDIPLLMEKIDVFLASVKAEEIAN